MKKNKPQPWPLWIGLAFIFSRIAALYFLDPYYFAEFHYEELLRGLFGAELIRGLNFPLLDFRPDNYSWAWFLTGNLVWLSFYVFSATVAALKFPAILFSLASLLLWYSILSTYFSSKAAKLFSLFYILSPVSFFIYSMSTIADHTEALLFITLSLYLYLDLISQKKKVSLWKTFFLGLVLGLGISYNLIVSLACLSIGLHLILRQERLLTNKFSTSFFPALFIGLSPIWAFHLFFDTSGFSIHGQPLMEHIGLRNLPNLFFGFAISWAPPFWGLAPGSKRFYILPYLFILAIAGLLYLAKRKKSQKTQQNAQSLLWTYTLVHLLTIGLTDFYQIRFFMPLHPFIYFWLALALTASPSRSKKSLKRYIPKFICAVWIMIFTLGLTPFLSWKHRGAAWASPGFTYHFLDSSVCAQPQKCLKRYDEIMTRFKIHEQHTFSSALAEQLVNNNTLQNFRSHVTQLDPQLPKDFRDYYFYFLGREIAMQERYLRPIIQSFEFLKEKALSDYRMAVLGALDHMEAHSFEDLYAFEYEIEPWFIPAYWRCVAAKEANPIYKYHQGSLDAILPFLEKRLKDLTPAHRKYYLQGIGKYLYQLWSSRPRKPHFNPKIIEMFPAHLQHDIFYGMGLAWAESEFSWRIASPNWYWKEFAEPLKTTSQQSIRLAKRQVLIQFLGAKE